MKEAVRSGRRANFYITENSFIDHYAREVGPVGIAVYHVLERHVNCETRATWIGTARMAELLNLSQRTIQRTLKTLEDLKLIRILRTPTMTTYVVVPVPSRPKMTAIPLFDHTSEEMFPGVNDEPASHDDQATAVSQVATPAPRSATSMSSSASSPSLSASRASHIGDTGVTAYKEEQNLPNKTSEQDQVDLPALQQSTRQIIAVLGLPATDSNRRMIEAALIAETGYTGQSLQEVAELIGRTAIRDREGGIPINKFYFEDAKWRQSKIQGGQNGRLSRAEQRKLDNLEINARVKQRFRDLLGTS